MAKTKQEQKSFTERQDQFKQCSSLEQAVQIVWRDIADTSDTADYGMYQHYTTLNRVLEKIITKRWYLTRCDSKNLNDLNEVSKYASYAKSLMRKSYIMCLGYGAGEDVAMWGLYANNDPLAIRISMPRKTVESWMHDLMERKCLDVQDGKRKRIEQAHLEQPVFRDMIYVAVQDKDALDEFDIRRTNTVRWGDAVCCPEGKKLKSEIQKSSYAGWLKDYEWHHEREARLCVRLKKEIPDEAISIAIPDNVMADMRFTFSPWLEDSMFKSIWETISAALKSIGIKPVKKIQRFRRSVLQGALNFR